MEIKQQISFMAHTCHWGPEQWPDVWGGNQWLSHSPAVVCRCCPDCNRPGPPLLCPSEAWPAAESSWGRNRRGGRRSKNVEGGSRSMIVICYFLLFLCCNFPWASVSRKCWSKGLNTCNKLMLHVCTRLWLFKNDCVLYIIKAVSLKCTSSSCKQTF